MRQDKITLMQKDTEILQIDLKTGHVSFFCQERMPYDLYLEEGDEFDTRINNLTNFRAWASSRILSLDRKYAKEILNELGFSKPLNDSDRTDIALTCRCLSLNDAYWTKGKEEITWKEVNLFDNSIGDILIPVALQGKSITITNEKLENPDIATDGTAPKAWVRKRNEFYLLKGDINNSAVRESESTEILERIGIASVRYRLDSFQGEPVSVCRCFTDKETYFARAGRLSIWCSNRDTVLQAICDRYKKPYDLMNLADYLIGNNDRHPDNWGFLYREDGQITDFAPLMDFDHAFCSDLNTLCLPERLLGRRITQEQAAKEAIERYHEELNLEADLSGFQYGCYTAERLEKLKEYLSDKEVERG